MSSRFNLKKYLFTPLLIGLYASLFFTLLNSPTSYAADMRKFNASNIMDDTVMVNKNALNEKQIQAFLDNKNTCKTNPKNPNGLVTINAAKTEATYTSNGITYRYYMNNGKFVCLADQKFNGESAAQIIYRAAQDYNINPQALIVLLEKEQGLITDNWPNYNIQYRSATGYGCPDTAACDTQYYGFKNQVRNAANFFRAHLNNNPCWSKPHIPGVKKAYWTPKGSCNGSEAINDGVKFHPNNACGVTPVNIKNRATAALYSYTPYQPNQAALNAGYGTGNNCSSYGNRNFWGLFTDWFGSTYINFVKLDEPRWIQVKNTTLKYDPATGEGIPSTSIDSGTQLKFTTKIFIDGQWLLRTEWDTSNGFSRGIPLADLVAIDYQSFDEPRWMRLPAATKKLNPITGGLVSQAVEKDTVAYFTSKIQVNGEWYFRTKWSTDRGISEAFPASTTTELSMGKMETNRWMRASRDTYAQNTASGYLQSTGVKVIQGSDIYFNGKIMINGEWYLHARNSTGLETGLYQLRDFHDIDLRFIPLESPRALKVTTNLRKQHPQTDEIIGIDYPGIPTGTILEFDTKILIGGEWLLRTKYDTQHNHTRAIPFSRLDHI